MDYTARERWLEKANEAIDADGDLAGEEVVELAWMVLTLCGALEARERALAARICPNCQKTAS